MNEELTLVTNELLERTSNLKERTMESMVVGDTYVVRGITIFEEKLKEINPDKIDEEMIQYIDAIINEYVMPLSSRHSNLIRYGISLSMMILYNYEKGYILQKKVNNGFTFK